MANIGGVWLDVDRRYYNPEGSGYAAIDLQPGYQKLNGQDALDFVRYRHTDSDIYRLARQQLFVQSFKQALASQFSPTDLPRIVKTVTDSVEVGQSDNKEFDVRTLLGYGLFLYDRPNVYQSKIDLSCYGDDDVAAITVDDSVHPQRGLRFRHAGRRGVREGDGGRARPQAEDGRAAPEGHERRRPQRERRAGRGRGRLVPAHASAAT